MAQMIDSLLSRLIVCLHSDDSAVSASQMGSMPVRGKKNRVVIYEKPQSICDINFQNECQNDVVPGSLNVSRCNALHGSRSEAFIILPVPAVDGGNR